MNTRPDISFLRHIHPSQVSTHSLAFTTTFGLGLTLVFLSAILIFSGLLLSAYYVPTSKDAYASILDIEAVASFGPIIRRMHRWAGHGLVLVSGLHCLRVTLVGAYRQRELNWLFGLGLLGLILGEALTGYLLPWDQTAYWAVKVVIGLLDHLPFVGTSLRDLLLGGQEINDKSLIRFYALHMAVLPWFMVIFIALHLWRLRRDGGLYCRSTKTFVPISPNLLSREVILGITILAIVLLGALIFEAPLGPPADPLRPTNPDKAPWYFLGLQELLSYSTMLGLIALGSAFLLLLALPWIESKARQFNDREASILKRYTKAWLLWMKATLILLVLIYLLATGVGFFRGPDWVFYWPWQEWPIGF